MCQDHHHQKSRAISLKDKDAHQEDHNNWNRRSFIKTLGLASGGGMAFGGYSISAMASGNFMPLFTNGANEDRVLVLIRLKGGNDGLNTIIPTFDYGTYRSARPNIAINQNNILPLNEAYGIPDSMQSIMPMWNEGQMKVINSVGYDNHNLSHFNSSDIWNSGNQNILSATDQSGWLGRYILDRNPDYLEDLPAIPGAIKISSGGNIAFQNQDQIDLAVSFNTPDRLLSIAETGFVYDTENLPDDCYYGEQVGFLRSLLNVSFAYAPQISKAYQATNNAVEYTANNDLARQLSIVARLIKGNLGTKLYMVTLNGFDTHEDQNQKHPQLMRQLTEAVDQFYRDLQSEDLDSNVLSMTFSEFGRRIRENQGGTDHGTAAPIMLFGPALNGNGILGDDPNLTDTDPNGNLKHSVDFRSVYASILENWLCLDPVGVDSILGDSYERLDGLGINCTSTSTNNVPIKQTVTHSIRPDGMGGMIIEYNTVRPADIEVAVYSILGQKIAQLSSAYQLPGKHEVTYVNRYAGISTMPLIYRISTQGKQYSGKFVVTGG